MKPAGPATDAMGNNDGGTRLTGEASARGADTGAVQPEPKRVELPEGALEADAGPGGADRPRIAVSYAHHAASQPDWFSDELADLARNAVAGLEAAGADAVVIDSASGHVFSALDYDGVLVLGGGDVDPARYGGNTAEPTVHGVDTRADETEIDLVIGAVENGRPVLGICRGLQLINVAFAGSLVEDLGPDSVHKVHQERPPMIGHTVKVEPGTLLADALGTGEVAVQSGHHQAVRRLGDRLRVSATAPDGVVEAVELARPDEGWLLAVQWHPEEPGSPEGQLAALVEPFVEACRFVAAAARR